MHKIEECAALICKAKNILVLTGAGMSTESGIPDFRSNDGLYSTDFQGLRPERILSLSFFRSNPQVFWDYISKCMNYTNIEPNIGHYILAKWQENKNITIVTQNIDQLHSIAGSRNVIEVHGTIKTAICQNINCLKKYSLEDIISCEDGHICKCGGYIKPDVVLYEEYVDKMSIVYPIVEKADLLIVLGTSLTVYPVAEIPEIFNLNSNKMIVINKTSTRYEDFQNCIEIHDSIGKTLEAIDLEMKKLTFI